MRIQVVGPHGMLGHEVLAAAVRRNHEVVESGVRLEQVLSSDIAAPVVVNCAGLVPQAGSPSLTEFIQVNAYGPARLAGACVMAGSRLIHVSTDCVFDGSGQGPYDETACARPTSDYGRSKLAGEITVAPHLTVRTSFIGRGERGLVAELERLSEAGGVYRASRRLLWTGHTARTVAEILIFLAERPEITGLLHVPAAESDRYRLAGDLKAALKLDVRIYETEAPAADRRLSSVRWKDLRLPNPPPWSWELAWLTYRSV